MEVDHCVKTLPTLEEMARQQERTNEAVYVIAAGDEGVFRGARCKLLERSIYDWSALVRPQYSPHDGAHLR